MSTAYTISHTGIEIRIPDSVVQAIRLPENRIKQELLKELALALYSQGIVSFGKARELAGMEKYEFGRLLGHREIYRHYGADELKDDLAYACGQ
jgi:predicted HTH domain antitoxin